jgi:KUP system potassium uptake protein
MVACIALVLVFRESSNLAAAYGIAVTGTMSITSILFFQLTRQWRWPLWRSVALVGLFLVFDLAFLAANAVKIEEGGWFPLVVAGGVFAMMTTWKTGRRSLASHILANTLPMELFMSDVAATKPHRVTGTAVFMTSNPEGAPPVLLVGGGVLNYYSWEQSTAGYPNYVIDARVVQALSAVPVGTVGAVPIPRAPVALKWWSHPE